VRHRFPVLVTDRLVLREPKRSDAPRLLAVWSDEEAVRYFGTGPLETRAQARKEIDAFRRQASSGDGIRWILAERGHGEYIGDIGFFDFAPEHARAEIGFLLDRRLWGRGLMREALAATLDYGFSVKCLHRVEALVDPRNSACLRLLERSGFQREGTLREYEFERDTFIDLVLLAVLQREWVGTRAEREPAGGEEGESLRT
jgi:[ribosomal protein S5]-alanine N-acetyltransferase